MCGQNREEGSKTQRTLCLPTTQPSSMFLNPVLGHGHLNHLSPTVLTPPFLDHRERQMQAGPGLHLLSAEEKAGRIRVTPAPATGHPFPVHRRAPPKRPRERQGRAGQRKPGRGGPLWP